MAFQTPISKVRGLGSAHEGVHHWWMQRISAIALIPLVLWMVYSLVHAVPQGLAGVAVWLASPYAALGVILFFLFACYHASLGVQMIVEDYISCKCLQIAKVIGVKLCFFVIAIAMIFAVIKLHFVGV